jgi:opacity protein-like surface antigen
MRIKAFLGAVALVLACPAAHAQDAQQPPPAAAAPSPPPAKPNDWLVGLRLGYARALSSDEGRGINYQTPSLIPIGIDLAYRATLHTYLGAFGQLALASRTDCTSMSASACKAKEYKIAFAVQYHFRPELSFDPWFGYALGVEVEHLSGFVSDQNGYVTRVGLEVASFQVGGDFLVRSGEGKRATRIGPFLGLGVGTTLSESGHAGALSLSNDGGGAFAWFSIGARGAFDL